MAIGKPSYRKGSKKTSDFKIGIMNGKPSLQVNWGGRIYGSQLSLIGAGGKKDSLNVADIRATGNITFGKNSSVYNNSNRILMVGGITVKGDDNLAIGSDTALSGLQSGATKNIGIGTGVGKDITTGIGNVLMGASSGDSVTSGSSNVYIGTEAGGGSTSSNDSVSIGNLNVALGHQAGKILSSTGVKTVNDLTPTPDGEWTYNQSYASQTGVASADGAGLRCDITTDGSGNPTFVILSPGGDYVVDEEIEFDDPSNDETATLTVASLTGTISPTQTVFLGYQAGAAMRETFTGSIGIGAYTLTTSGNYNIGLGYKAGFSPHTYGAYNILIGYEASVSDTTAENQVAIGKGVTCTANNTTVIGNTDIVLDAATDLILDGDTFIKLYDGGSHYGTFSKTAGNTLSISSQAGNIALVPYTDKYIKLSGSTGFLQVTAAFDATDTDIDFRDGNKQILTLTADIVDVHFQFPDVSGNFLCIFLQDGTGGWDVSNWKTKDEAGNPGNGNSGVVLWAGGSATTLTETADKVDIISLYWDATNEMAYAVASENF